MLIQGPTFRVSFFLHACMHACTVSCTLHIFPCIDGPFIISCSDKVFWCVNVNDGITIEATEDITKASPFYVLPHEDGFDHVNEFMITYIHNQSSSGHGIAFDQKYGDCINLFIQHLDTWIALSISVEKIQDLFNSDMV